VTDEGSTHGTPIFQRRIFSNWRPIGKLIFDNAVTSYNGDFVIHFNHPTWRDDRNDASTATRVNNVGCIDTSFPVGALEILCE
jgi:hypothetical protein